MPPAQTSTPPSQARPGVGGYRQSASLGKIPSPGSMTAVNGRPAARNGAPVSSELRTQTAQPGPRRRPYTGPWLKPVEYADESSASDDEAAVRTPRVSTKASRWSLPGDAKATSRSRNALLSALSAVRQAEAALHVAGDALDQALRTVAAGSQPGTDTDELLTADESHAETSGVQAPLSPATDPNLTLTSRSPSEGMGIALGSPLSERISAPVPSRIGAHLNVASLSRPASRRDMYASIEDSLPPSGSASEAETATKDSSNRERQSAEQDALAAAAGLDRTPTPANPARVSGEVSTSDLGSDVEDTSPSFRFELDVPSAELQEGRSSYRPGTATPAFRERRSKSELGLTETRRDSTFLDPPSRHVSLQPERRVAPKGSREIAPLIVDTRTGSPELKSFMEPSSAAPSEGDFGAHLAFGFGSSERILATQELNDDSTLSASASTLIERAENFLQEKRSGTIPRSTAKAMEDCKDEGDETAELIDDACYQPLPQPIAEPHQLSLIEECTEPVSSSGWDTTRTLISDCRGASHHSSPEQIAQVTPRKPPREDTSTATANILDLYAESAADSPATATPSRRYLASTDHTPASTSVLAALIGHNLAADISFARNDGPATPEGGDVSLPQFGSPDGTPLRQVRAQYVRMLQMSRMELGSSTTPSAAQPLVPNKSSFRSPDVSSPQESSVSTSRPQLGKSHWSSATSSWNLSSDSKGFQLRSDLATSLDACADSSMPSAATTGVAEISAAAHADEIRDDTSAQRSSGSLHSGAISSEGSPRSGVQTQAQTARGHSNSLSRGTRTSLENQQRRKLIQEQRLKAHQQGVLSVAALVALTSFDSEAGTPLTPVALEELSTDRNGKQRAATTPGRELLTDGYALLPPPPRQESAPFSHPREAPCPPPRGVPKKRSFLPQRRTRAAEAHAPSDRWPSDESRVSSGAMRSPPPPPQSDRVQSKPPPLPSLDDAHPGEDTRGSGISVTKWLSRKAKGFSGQTLQPRKMGSFDALKDLVSPKKTGRPRSASVRASESTDDSDATTAAESRQDDIRSPSGAEVGTGWLSTHGNELLAPQTPETYRSASPHSRDWARVVSPDTLKGPFRSTSESFAEVSTSIKISSRAKQVAEIRRLQLIPQTAEASSYFTGAAPAAQSTPSAPRTAEMRRADAWGEASPTLPPPHSARTPNAPSTSASERDYRRGSWLLAQAQSPLVRRVSVRSLGEMPVLDSALPASEDAAVRRSAAHDIGETPPVHPSSSRRRLSDLILRYPLA